MPRQTRPSVLIGVVLAIAFASAGCRGGDTKAQDVTISWKTAAAPIVGHETIADVTLHDAAQRPVRGARIELQAFMPHPGMAPVVTTAEERGGGVYRGRLRFTMAGPWTVIIRGSLPDGRTVTDRVEIPDVQAGGHE